MLGTSIPARELGVELGVVKHQYRAMPEALDGGASVTDVVRR